MSICLEVKTVIDEEIKGKKGVQYKNGTSFNGFKFGYVCS
jgi:hypothetical protein